MQQTHPIRAFVRVGDSWVWVGERQQSVSRGGQRGPKAVTLGMEALQSGRQPQEALQEFGLDFLENGGH